MIALRWGLFQKETLSATDFNIAQAVGMALRSRWEISELEMGLEISEMELTTFLDSNISASVDFCCRQLVRFREEGLELVQSSLKTHLTTGKSDFKFLAEEERTHGDLACICITYLPMSWFKNLSSNIQSEGEKGGWERRPREQLKKHAFLRYAALYWFEHCTAASETWRTMPSKAKQRRKLLDPGPAQKGDRDMYPYAEFWASTWWLVTRRPARGYYPHDCPAHRIVAEAAGKMAHLSWKNKQGELSTWASPKPIVHLNKGKERGRAAVVSRQNNIW